MLEGNMFSEDRMAHSDVVHLAQVIKVLALNFDKLDASRQITTVNLILKLAFTRDASALVLPPMDDLGPEKSKPKKSRPKKPPAPKKKTP